MIRDTQVTFKTTQYVKDEAKKLALIDSRSMSQVIDHALRELIKKRKAEEKKAR